MDDQCPVNITDHVIAEVRKNPRWIPPLQTLDEIGRQLRIIPITSPIRYWWSGHRLMYLSESDDVRKAEVINSQLLWAQGEQTPDTIDIDF